MNINHYKNYVDGMNGIYYGNKKFFFDDTLYFKIGTDVVNRTLQEHEKDMIDNTIKPNFYKCDCCCFMTHSNTHSERYDNMKHHIKTKKHKRNLKEFIESTKIYIKDLFEKEQYYKMVNELMEQKK
jgi:hypothetical protein